MVEFCIARKQEELELRFANGPISGKTATYNVGGALAFAITETLSAFLGLGDCIGPSGRVPNGSFIPENGMASFIFGVQATYAYRSRQS